MRYPWCKQSFLPLILLTAATAGAQQKYNPVTQIDWPKATGNGAPALSCTFLNYGQPYTDLTNNKQYNCSTSGWITGTGGGGGSPAGPNYSLQMNNVGNFGAAPVTTDSTLQQLLYAGGNVPINGSGQYINQQSICSPTTLNALPAGQQQGQQMCANVQYYPTDPGWVLGNPGLGGVGVMNTHIVEASGRIASAGIKAGYFLDMNCDSAGDCAGYDQVVRARGSGGPDYSGEGYGGIRSSLQEGGETSGTVTTNGSNLSVIPITQVNNTDGVGLPLHSPSYDVIATTGGGAVAGVGGHYATLTVPATLPVSLMCSTVAQAVTVGTLPENATVLKTFTVNTTADLSSAAPSNMLFSNLLPFIQAAWVLNTGTYNSGAHTQTLTMNLNKSISNGSQYCVGGMAGRGMEVVKYTINGSIYLLDVIGSPTANTVWYSAPGTQGPAPPNGAPTGNLNFFHKATITDVSAPGQFSLSDNDIHWFSGDAWISTNTVSQIRYDALSLGLWNDPYTVDQGLQIIKQGLSTTESQFYFLKNQTASSNYIGHGGAYPGPNLATVYGVSNGVVFDAVPDTCFHSGNPCAPAFFSFGVPSAGTSVPVAIVASNRGGGDAEQLTYNFSNNSWNLTTNGNGYLFTDNFFQAGAALVDPAHSIEASGSSNVSTVGADTPAAVYIENRNGTGSTHEDLFFGLEDSFNQRAAVGGLSMVNVSNSHFGPIGDLHVWLNNAGTPLDAFTFAHDGGLFAAGATGGDKGLGSGNFSALFINGTAVGTGGMTWPTTPGITVCTGTPCTAWGTSLAIPLTVPNGGTGATTFAVHGVMVGEAGSPLAVTAAGALNAVFMGQGGSSDPLFVAQPAIDCTNCTNFPAQNYKEAAKYATTGALPASTYSNGSSGVGATLTETALGALSVDGATPSIGDRVLVKNQVSTLENGIYSVTVVGSGGTSFVLTRTTDFNRSGVINSGDAVFITLGTVNSTTSWAYTGISAPTMGTTGIVWAQIAGPGSSVASLAATSPITTTGATGAITLACPSCVTGTVANNSRVQRGAGSQLISDGCGSDDGTTFDTGNCPNTIFGKGLASSGTAPTVGKFATYTNDTFTAATSGDPANGSNLYLIAGSHVIGGVTYFFACSPGTVCPATFTNTAVNQQSVEYDPTTQLAKSVATCTPGNWLFGKTDGSGNVLSQPHRCPYTTSVNSVLLATQNSVNFINSTVNAVGLTLTFSNPSGNNVKAEITGGAYTGTAANLSGTPALPNGTTATTQALNDNSTNVATTAYADRIASGSGVGTIYLSPADFGTVGTSVTTYISLTGSGGAVTVLAQKQSVMPAACTFQNMYVQAIATTSAGTAAITLLKNGSPTSLACTVGASTTAGLACSDTNAGHNVSVVAGDLVNWQVVTNATAGITNATIAYPSVQCK